MSDNLPVVASPGAAPTLLRPIAKAADFIAVHTETAALIRDALQKDRDYGKVPGTAKDTLLKPGAERLCLAFGLRAAFEIMEQEVDHDRENRHKGGVSYGLYRFSVRCLVYGPDGREVGQGIGSCSSLESKYISRPRDSENTVLKMAKKRALVDAVLSTLGLSDRFTQDVEEMRANEDAAQPIPTGVSVDERVRNAGLYFRRTIGGTPEQLAELQAAVPANTWHDVALEAERKGIATFAALMRFAKEGVAPEPQEAIDAEFSEAALDPSPEAEKYRKFVFAATAQKGIEYTGDGRRAVLAFLNESRFAPKGGWTSSTQLDDLAWEERAGALRRWIEEGEPIPVLDAYIAQQGSLAV